ncbi:unnamed protein product [Penicillium roqueforti FM164]|uniref:Uncharacterized protein n=1 Tax=Penicillium roqueforti (strain FM164) TaxID=1365484 RepID=W6QMX5_PENRF|nr:unnamed protein product [Penicillium roqueforti FM164]
MSNPPFRARHGEWSKIAPDLCTYVLRTLEAKHSHRYFLAAVICTILAICPICSTWPRLH